MYRFVFSPSEKDPVVIIKFLLNPSFARKMKKNNRGNTVSASMIFKTMERYVVMAFQMIVQIVIARILDPSDYGLISMMTVFIAVANVFIQNGFNMAIVQKKDADITDYSTALIINLSIGVVLYLLIVLFSPAIASFYYQPYITKCMPVMALLLIIGSVNAIQIAIANRHMLFKNLFKCNVVASFSSGVIGIVSAICGLGVWALIIQQILHSLVLSIMLLFQQHWKPNWVFDKTKARELFSFGWKLLAAGLINQIYNELNSLVIGRRYHSDDLAFYTKGSQFPKYVTTGVDSSINTVMFSAFSKNQENVEALHKQMKKSITVNSYIVFPILTYLGIAAVPIVKLLLTDKWLPMVPFMQICCLTFAFHPLASTQMQAIAAVGRSDVRLKIEFLKKGIGIGLLILMMSKGPMGIAISAAITSIVSIIIGAVACRITTGYPLKNLLTDIAPILLASIVMAIPISFIGRLGMEPVWTVIIELFIGFLVYGLTSYVFKLYGFNYMMGLLKSTIHRNER